MKSYHCKTKRIVIALMLVSLPALMFAYSVRGRFVESVSGEACIATHYNIYAAKDTVKPLLSGSSDMEGGFSQTLPEAGRYILKADYPGFRNISVIFNLTESKPDMDLGIVKFEDEGKKLDEVVVVARKDLIQSDGTKLTYDVEQDPSAAGNTVMEMLRRVPMVTVDGEDNIKVKGQSNFKIYINGKPDPMLSGDPKAVLKAMPASSIKKIEVITDPGAKYEAEGTAGILNIITVQKQSLEGYNGSVRGSFGSGYYSGSLYARTKVRNVTSAVRLNGYNGSILQSHGRSSYEREDFGDAIDHFYRSKSESLNKSTYWQGGLDVSWEPDTLNLFTVSASYSRRGGHSMENIFYSMSSAEEDLQWSYRNDSRYNYSRTGISVNTSYQHTFPNNKLHTLTMTYQFDYGRTPTKRERRSFDYFNFPGNEEPFRTNTANNYYGTHTFQVDYVLPLFGDKHTFETGAKGVIRPNRESRWTASSANGNDYNDDSALRLTQHNDVYALYVSYSAKFGKFSGRAGLRYEHTRMGIDYKKLFNTGDYKDFTQRLNDWVPNASLTYKLTDNSSLLASYAMRIWRPSVGQLNPFVNDLTYGELSYGNPDLKSEKSHRFELKYSNYGGKLGGEFSVSYLQSDNEIYTYRFLQDGILNTTYANIGHYKSVDMGAWLEYAITPVMNISSWMGAYYQHIEAQSLDNTKSRGWQAVLNLNYSYTMPWRLRLDAWGGFWTPWKSLQSKGDDTGYYYGLSISRTFLKDNKLRVAVNAGDFLEGRRHYRNTTTTPTFRSKNNSDYSCWSLGISVSYNFGSLRSDVKRTRANVSNDDISNGSSGGNGGSKGN